MDPFLGELRCFGFTFAPYGWFQCNGQLLAINQYAALFSILGTYYGGNGTQTFGLPNLQAIVPICQGAGPGLSPFVIGQTAGSPTHQLLFNEMPVHSHPLLARATPGADFAPTAGESTAQGHAGAGPAATHFNTYTANPPGTTLLPAAVGISGGNLPHENIQPSLTMYWCIAWQGVFPTRS
jgi:microcystin-dependent protein